MAYSFRCCLSVLALCLAACPLVFACSSEAGLRDAAIKQGEVLATVNGVNIYRRDLRLETEPNAQTIREALARAVNEELLVQEALERGVSSAALSKRSRQLAVQELLRIQVEEPNRPEDISRELVEERYRERADEFDQPLAKKSIHFLVRLDKDASAERSSEAQQIARAAWRQMTDETAVRGLLTRNKSKEEGFSIIVERLPFVSRTASFDPAFLDALFSHQGTGRVSGLVRTQFGWHAIWVLDVRRPRHVPLDRVEPEIREELAVEARRAAVEELLENLRKQTSVKLAREKVRPLLGEKFRIAEVAE